MSLVAGVDSSTQSVKVVVRDAATGAEVRAGRAPHPDGTECPPAAWWDALRAACAGGLLDGVEAVSVAGQQHGMVALDPAGEVVRPALLWNDTRSAPDAADLVDELGGPAAWAEAVGSVPVASFTVTKLRWLARAEPQNAARVGSVLLPHDWLTWLLAGRPETATTDRGDASGTGYWSPAAGAYRPDLLGLALGRTVAVPRVAGPAEPVGRTADGVLLGPGTGDNMGAALGLGLDEGDVVVSLGTSGTAFAVVPDPPADASGQVAGFADGTGRFLPLVATLNAARVLTAGAGLLGVDLERFGELALSARAGRRRPGAAAVPRRGAHAQPAGRERDAGRDHPLLAHARQRGQGVPRGDALRAGRRGRRAGRPGAAPGPGAAHRRRSGVAGGARGRTGAVRAARARPGGGGVRG